MSAAAAALQRELTVPTTVAVRRAHPPRRSHGGVDAVRAKASPPSRRRRCRWPCSCRAPVPTSSQAELLTGYPPDTPAAVVVRVTWPDETIVRTTVGELAASIRSTGADRTVLVLVGEALGERARAGAQPPVFARARHVVPIAESERLDRRSSEPAAQGVIALVRDRCTGVGRRAPRRRVVRPGRGGGACAAPTFSSAPPASTKTSQPAALPGTPVELWGRIDELAELCDERSAEGTRVCVLASGDPGFFGIVRGARRPARSRDGSTVHPAPSSVTLAFARVGLPWDDAVIATCHGRPIEPAADVSRRHHKVAVLVSRDSPPEALGRAVVDAGCSAAGRVGVQPAGRDRRVRHAHRSRRTGRRTRSTRCPSSCSSRPGSASPRPRPPAGVGTSPRSNIATV